MNPLDGRTMSHRTTPNFRTRSLLLGIALLCTAAPAHAQPTLTLSFKPGKIERLVPVTAHDARCAALQENLGLLAFGHDRTFPEAQISLYKLDAQGLPGLKPAATWKLPYPVVLNKDPSLAKEVSFPLALAFHPKLPLLYIWQDVAVNPNLPKFPPGTEEIDHLLIYDVSKSPPQLVVGMCRGKDLLVGQTAATLAVDPDGAFLYIPNFRDDKNAAYWHMGRFPLDADGLPKVLEKDAPLPERIKQITAVNATKSVLPAQRTMPENVNFFPCNNYGSSASIHVLNRDTVLLGGSKSLITWRPDDKLVALSCLPIKFAYATLMAVHPKLPGVYVTKLGTNSVFHAQQIDGNWTMLPTEWQFTDRIVSSPPAVLPKTNQVVVGGRHRLFVVDLDAEGNGKTEAREVPIFNDQCRVLLYSPKFDRLYVAVDLSR